MGRLKSIPLLLSQSPLKEFPLDTDLVLGYTFFVQVIQVSELNKSLTLMGGLFFSGFNFD